MSPTPLPNPINYLALGDSTGIGVGARNGGYVARLFKRIISRHSDARLTNLCVTGATTSEVLREQLPPGAATKPNLVTLGIGINDIGHGVSLDQFARNYDEILSTLRNQTEARIVVTNIPDISSAPRIPDFARSQYQQTIIAFNQQLEAIAARHEATIFDVYTITHEQLQAHPEFFSSDGFHPSDAGYELWADQMWPVIARTIDIPSGSKSLIFVATGPSSEVKGLKPLCPSLRNSYWRLILMNRSILERELKKVRVSLKGWVPALKCDDCKEIWQPFHVAVGAKAPTAKLDYWRCPNNCNFSAHVSREIQTALPEYVMINDIPGMIFGVEDMPDFERYVRSMDATAIPNRGAE